MPRISVRVAAGHDPDAMGACRRVCGSIADAVVGLEVLYRNDLRAQRHHRLHADHLGGVVRKRRGAVQHDAGTHDVPADFAEAHDSRRIRDRAWIGKSFACCVEDRGLFLEPVLFVRAREMRHEAQSCDGIALREPLDQRSHLARTHDQPVHPRVDLQENLDRTLEMRTLEHRHLFRMMDDRREAPGREFGKLVRREESLEQQDPARVVRCAQFKRGIELADGKTVGVGERRQHAHEAVPVGVGLDHREDLRPGRAHSHLREICTQRSNIDLGKQRAGHGARAVGGRRIVVGEWRPPNHAAAGQARLRPTPQSWYKARAAAKPCRLYPMPVVCPLRASMYTTTVDV